MLFSSSLLRKITPYGSNMKIKTCKFVNYYKEQQTDLNDLVVETHAYRPSPHGQDQTQDTIHNRQHLNY